MHRKEKSICDNNYMPNDSYIFFRTFCTMTNMKKQYPMFKKKLDFLNSQDATLGKQKPIMHRKEKSICDNNYMPNDLCIFFRTFYTMTNMKMQYLMFK